MNAITSSTHRALPDVEPQRGGGHPEARSKLLEHQVQQLHFICRLLVGDGRIKQVPHVPGPVHDEIELLDVREVSGLQLLGIPLKVGH